MPFLRIAKYLVVLIITVMHDLIVVNLEMMWVFELCFQSN